MFCFQFFMLYRNIQIQVSNRFSSISIPSFSNLTIDLIAQPWPCPNTHTCAARNVNCCTLREFFMWLTLCVFMLHVTSWIPVVQICTYNLIRFFFYISIILFVHQYNIHNNLWEQPRARSKFQRVTIHYVIYFLCYDFSYIVMKLYKITASNSISTAFRLLSDWWRLCHG